MSDKSLSDRLGGLLGSLDQKVKERVSNRSGIEQRWLEDLRAYHGQYDPDVASKLKAEERSALFINMVGPKTDAVIAKLEDLLFPTDDSNWDIGPSPVPVLSESAAKAVKAKEEAQQQRDQMAEQAIAEQNPDLAVQALQAEEQVSRIDEAMKELHKQQEEAKDRCNRMKSEIEDQLSASSYQAECRDLIEQAGKLGTGVLKGPVVNDKAKWRWLEGEGGHQLTNVAENRPAARFVDVWNFFPGEVGKVEDSEGFFERHLLNKHQIRKLKNVPGFNEDALRRLIKEDPRDNPPSYLQQIKELGDSNKSGTRGKLYHVWEYNGPVDEDDLTTLMEALPQEGDADILNELDPLEELHVVIWFCDGQLLKFELHPLDTGDPIYSVFNIKKAEGSLFGYGIPRMLWMAQDMLNSGARAMMDNADKTVGPQIVIDRTRITPADNKWDLKPFKIWYSNDGIPKDERIFDMFHIDGHQTELANIMAIAKQNIDEESGLPKLAQGEQGSGVTRTFNGMALLINATNVVFKRIVRNFDDDISVPTIRRFYHWNMQFSNEEAIKGDYEVAARGSSVLLVREIQAQNLMSAAEKFGNHPVYGPIIKPREMVEEAFKSMSLPINICLKTEDELKKDAEEAKNNPPPIPPEVEIKQQELQLEQMRMEAQQAKDQAELADRQQERQARIQIAVLERETRILMLAEKSNIELEKIRANSETAIAAAMTKLQDSREERQHKKEQLAGEVQATLITGQASGGLA